MPHPQRSAAGWRLPVGAALVATLASCAYLPLPPRAAAPRAEPHLVAIDADQCRALLVDDAPLDSLQEAAARSLAYLQKLPADRVLTVLDRQVTAGDLAGLVRTVSELRSEHDWAQEVCERFQVYRVDSPHGLLVTGYYQPELAASRTRTERFRYPLYRTPDDLVDVDLGQFCPTCSGRFAEGRVQHGQLVPYYSRAEIDAGVLRGHGYELAWLDDPVEAFFLHIQGSARLRFDDGVQMEISYGSSNGRPYTSLGRLLVERGKLAREDVSLPALKAYLRAHPAEQAELMAANQRYIFFRPVATGPIGSLGVPLTDGRSIAADRRLYPAGGLAFLRIRSRDWRSAAHVIARFTLIQDAGAAITGADRVDVYWGTGATAEAIAGDMRNPGELYLVLPR